jgi:hypothetical protein
VLRDNWFTAVSAICTKAGIEGTNNQTYSNINFAQLNASCDTESLGLLKFFIGTGLRSQVEWDFALLSVFKNWDTNNGQYFQPMLKSLNIYGP